VILTTGQSDDNIAGRQTGRLTKNKAFMTPEAHEITQLLLAWSKGDSEALDRLFPLVYDELRRLAKSYMRKERAGHTLQTTALIHEVYLRLIDAGKVEWRSRAHFFGVAARAMRQILVAMARERGCQKRGGGALQVSLDEAMMIDEGLDEDLVALDEALGELVQFDARKAQVVEMRFFGGLTEEEIAAALEVSPETVRRDWRLARSWLRRQLSVEQGDGT
jgi:RNA polymerase sigma factor (TIGR02999 family)